MESDRFNRLVQSMTRSGSRRGLLGLLAAVPVFGGLAALLGHEAMGKGRRMRRQKAGHEKDPSAEKHKKKRSKKKKRKQCRPRPFAITCAGKCGLVPDNCQKTVNCGSCGCNSACPACQRCNSTTQVCEPDPSQTGNACGSAGQLCLLDGTCACHPETCDLGTVCRDGTCQACGFEGAPCCSSNNCQAGEVCIAGACELCGQTGEQCCANDTCNVGRVCLAGTCQDCGFAGEPCCANNACLGGATCDSGQCV